VSDLFRGTSLRVLIVVVVVAAMAYGAAVVLYLTGAVGSVAGLIMLAAGVVLLPVMLFIVRRRVWNPLAQLEKGLQKVSEGDLTIQVPIVRHDELGAGWVWGRGLGRVTVRFEGPLTPPGPVRTLSADDAALHAGDPPDWRAPRIEEETG